MPFLHPTAIISILVAISIHEWAHAITAHTLGDPTPERAGRLTINPIAHIDPLGALMFLFVGFGWAKPVPVNPAYFRHPKRDMVIVALAGPFSNLILAFIAFVLLAVFGPQPLSSEALLQAPVTSSIGMTMFLMILETSLFINLGLMAFNLFPIAPLDGSNILRLFIPVQWEDRYEEFTRIGPFILLGLLLFESVLPIPILTVWVMWIMDAVLTLFAMVVPL